ncbi:MAG: GAF domain-containing protein [Rhodocyclaceae bacterium]|nr:GAF domain-containing protein [Rhodocyclaceae bacterium]MCL4680065.1 GAF domain-containing protein [Rhodocyclaceae bacterium]
MKHPPDSSPDPQAELAALRKRIAELESHEAELAWAHGALLERISQEHKRTESALRLSEEKLSRIYAASPDAIAISSLASGCYVDVNPAFGRVFGFAPDEVIGHKAVEVGAWPEPAARDEIVRQLREQGELVNHEIRFRHKSGRPFDSLFSASLVELNGEPCMLSITRDISDRKQIEQLILEKNRMLQAVSEAQADFIADADPHPTFDRLLSHLLDVTDSRYGFIGEVFRDKDGSPFLKPHAITDISWDDASRQLHRSYVSGGFEFRNLKTLFGHVMTSGRPVLSNSPAEDPRRGGLPPGHPPLNAFMGLPLYRGTELVGMLGVANRPGGYDDTLVEHLQPFTVTCAVLIEAYRQSRQRQHAEQMLRQLNLELEDHVSRRTAELQASIKELENFSYSVSHDLRSPLRGINGFSRLLQEDYGDRLDEQGKEYLRRICAATLRMSELIDGMIDLAQLTREPIQPAEADLSRLARAVAQELQAAEPERKAVFAIAPGVKAHGDERLLRVVLQKLFANAWKFSAQRDVAHIEFGARQADGDLAYFVRDDGVGFDMKYVDKLFGAFQRLHGIKEFAGTGIGLATVQRIVQRHGGRVWAEGETGKGATFYFTLS